MIAGLCTFLAVLAAPTLGQVYEGSLLISPCPAVFTYERQEFNRWCGVIDLSTANLNSLFLSVELGSTRADVKPIIHYVAVTGYNATKTRFCAYYDPMLAVPIITHIMVKERVICSGEYEKPTCNDCYSPISKTVFRILRTRYGYSGESGCGMVKLNPLALYSTRALNTQWPWQVALYQTQVADIFVNPHYNAHTYSSDVAILELNRPLNYTNSIRSACLWPDQDTDPLIGAKGVLLSWDFDDKGDAIGDLSQEEMSVVSRATCIKSHSQYTDLTSEYTYCAGNRQEKSSYPSAGSGMVFRRYRYWYLRGLLSISVPRQNRSDPTHYLVFTDLAKFLPWIHSTVYDF